MKAIVCTKYGSPEVLQLREVKKPTPKSNEVLIKVHASTVTAGDVRLRSCTWAPWFWLPARIMFGFLKPRQPIPGNELSGEIEAVGKDIGSFKVGDQIFGITWTVNFGGANAEYICLPENEVAIKPVNMTFEEAATVPIGGLTALVLLRKSKIKKEQRVLIYGASGSVGVYAVQLAKHFGADVTAVCSTSNIDFVKSLGADEIIDYTKEDFSRSDQTYDIIFDAVMKAPYSKCKKVLNRKGTYITVDYPLLLALWISLFSKRKVVFGIAKNIEDLAYIRELIEACKIGAVIDRCYPLEQTAEAHRYVEMGHKKGNVAIKISNKNN
ncbi:MAG: NAD(P)-dependent alcohol dehydrogenase [Planctomycetota bacterium]|jgi:NADPH:quinone reductase-like Zn-dependent oxidoreductase